MANGITIEHSANGEPIFARIDLRKYGKQLKEFFVKNKVQVESGKSPYDPEFVKMVLSQDESTFKEMEL